MFYRVSKSIAAVSMTAMLLTSCSGGSEGTGLTSPVLHGVIEAPGGAIAFNKPDLWQRMFASVVGTLAFADITGVASVGVGVTVNLIEVDASGNQVEGIIATATTDSAGEFTINTPAGFTAGSQYVLRAIGTSEVIEARVSGTTVDINPITDAASQLVTAKISNLDAISTAELKEFVTTLGDLSQNVDPAGLSAQSLSEAMQAEAVNDSESSNVISSAATTGQICGIVTNASNQGLENIRIVVRDYGNWVTRAKTKTTSDGRYCLNVPKSGDPDSDTGGTFNGQYILGALNRTDDSSDPNRSASEWWSISGTGVSQFAGEKITVMDTTTVTKNFQLANGARISGSISDSGTGSTLEGIQVNIRRFDTRAPVASARAKADGTYRINLIAGNYYVEARNTTVQAFASEVYDGANGSNNSNHGIPVSLTTGQNHAIDFALVAGYQLSGVIRKGELGSAVTGRRVMVNLTAGGPSVRLRTNKLGNYRVWLLPATYNIYSYGQASVAFELTPDSTVNFFSQDVSSITATVLHNNLPVRQAKVRLYNSTGGFVNMEPSSSDGTVTVFTAGTGDYRIEARVDRQEDYGTIVYGNTTRLSDGDVIKVASVGSTVAAGDITLPSGGVLTGKVTTNGIDPMVNFRVAVRDDNNLLGTSGGVTNADYFTQMRTRGDGSFLVSLPAGIYDRVKMRDASLNVINHNANCNTVTIVAGETTTINYNNATDTCVVQ